MDCNYSSVTGKYDFPESFLRERFNELIPVVKEFAEDGNGHSDCEKCRKKYPKEFSEIMENVIHVFMCMADREDCDFNVIVNAFLKYDEQKSGFPAYKEGRFSRGFKGEIICEEPLISVFSAELIAHVACFTEYDIDPDDRNDEYFYRMYE